MDAFSDVIAAADLLVTGFEIRIEVARRALEIARRHGVRTLLNPAPAPAEPLDADPWSLVDVRGGVQVKASGSIKSYDQAASLLRAGAVLLGTSAGKAIVAGTADAERGGY